MIEQRAQILSVENGQLSLRPMPRAECPRCAAGQGCGGQLFGYMRDNKSPDNTLPDYNSPLLISAPKDLCVQAGDVVIVGIRPQQLQQAALLLYTLPLLVVVLVAGFVAWLEWSEAVQVLLVGVALVVSFLLVKQQASHLAQQPLLTVLRKEPPGLCDSTVATCKSGNNSLPPIT